MSTFSQPLAAFARNITSQNGEDGLLEEIFRRIGESNRWCFEVGAWDGEHLSNTCSFWRDRGWAAVLVECSAQSFALLKTKTGNYPKVQPIHRLVTADGNNSLDAILREAKAPPDIDLVSIDVDGNDYYLFESLKEFKPRTVIVEHNPTIPPEIEVVQKLDSRARCGSSAGALVSLARKKGYALAASTHCNCIFVRADEFSKLGYAPLDINAIFSRKHLVYLMSCYNGKTFVSQEPLYAGLKRSVRRWLRNFLRPADITAWPEKTIPVVCQKAVRNG